MSTFHRSAPQRQRGVTLVVAMMFLLILSIFAVSGFNSGTTNTRITGNMIARQEAQASAQLLIDRTLSSAEFAEDPSSVAAETLDVDMTGDGAVDYIAQLTPAPVCHRLRAVKNSDLTPEDPADLPCVTGSSAEAGKEFGATADTTSGDSLCANTEWNVRAVATDSATGVSVAINQGVGVRSDKTEAENLCL